MRVRPFRAADEPGWRRLRQALWPQTTDIDHSADLAAYLDALRTHLILIAESTEGAVVGFAEVRIRSHADECFTSPAGYLEGWYVRSLDPPAGAPE
jgi:aminoglycoside 6'-N-acetyltransferase I